MNEETMYELLDVEGKAIAHDIRSDLRLADEIDTDFECYVRYLDGEIVGYVYMGEYGEWAYRPSADGKKLESDPAIVERVKNLTPYKGW